MIISKANRVVLLPEGQVPNHLFDNFREIDVGGKFYRVINHNPDMTVLLNRMGYNVPNPITYYDWNGGTPFDVQKATVALLTSETRAYVLNDMGTGKTRSALWAWDWLNTSKCAEKLLVVAPLSTLRFVWQREAFAILPQRKVVVLHGSRAKRLDLLASDADIYIINHDGLKTIEKEIADRPDIDTLIIDELAVYRNSSQRSKQMRKFAPRFKWAWGMTGRPMPNAPTDVWAQCKILTPRNVPDFFRHAQSSLMIQVSQYIWKPKPNALDTAYSWMQPAVRFSLDDVVELPEAIFREIDVELSEEQKKTYQRLYAEMCVMVQQKVITAANAGVAINKLVQVGSGYVYTTKPDYVVLDSQQRKEVLIEIIEQAARKVIVFAPFLHLISGLEQLLSASKIDYAVVNGDVPEAVRGTIFNAFQNTNKYKVLLAHPACLHHGVTLTAADTIVWYCPILSNEVYEQANARIRRYGQQHKQQFIHLQATPTERKLFRNLENKQKIQADFLSMFEGLQS